MRVIENCASTQTIVSIPTLCEVWNTDWVSPCSILMMQLQGFINSSHQPTTYCTYSLCSILSQASHYYSFLLIYDMKHGLRFLCLLVPTLKRSFQTITSSKSSQEWIRCSYISSFGYNFSKMCHCNCKMCINERFFFLCLSVIKRTNATALRCAMN